MTIANAGPNATIAARSSGELTFDFNRNSDRRRPDFVARRKPPAAANAANRAFSLLAIVRSWTMKIARLAPSLATGGHRRKRRG